MEETGHFQTMTPCRMLKIYMILQFDQTNRLPVKKKILSGTKTVILASLKVTMETWRRRDTSRLSRMLEIYMRLQFDQTNWFPVRKK